MMDDRDYWEEIPSPIPPGYRIEFAGVELVAVDDRGVLSCSECHFHRTDGCRQMPCTKTVWATPLNAVILALET